MQVDKRLNTQYVETYMWFYVFGLCFFGFLITTLGNAMSYINSDYVVVDNLFMPLGAMVMFSSLLWGATLGLYQLICRVIRKLKC